MFTNYSQLEKMIVEKWQSEGVSKKTVRWYIYGIRRFSKFMRTKANPGLLDATERDIRDFLIWLTAEKRYSAATVRGNLTTLKIFYGYFESIGLVRLNPTKEVKRFKIGEKVVMPLTKEETKQMSKALAAYPGGGNDNFIAYRDYAIILTFLGTGIRKSELLDMRISEIDLEAGFFRVLGKGKKERIIPLGTKLSRALRNYFRQRTAYLKGLGTNTDAVWVNRNGHALTDSGIDFLFRRIRELRTKWSTRISAHTLRHTFAINYIKNGGDVFSLQRILGHSDITTTRIYVEMCRDDIIRQAQKFNPLDNEDWTLI